jgi:hypothetical protein
MNAPNAAREAIAEPLPALDPRAPVPPEYAPDYDSPVTEDDTPVDNLFSEKQQRLLTESLYVAWPGPRGGGKFLTTANVGLFFTDHDPPLVPDVLLSMHVEAPKKDLSAKRNRSYFIWRFGKPPEVVIEVASNREGHEDGSKIDAHARLKIDYYVIFDPFACLSEELLRVFVLREGAYIRLAGDWLGEVGLGLSLWQGEFEDMQATWLRWRDKQGLIPTGKELVESERRRADEEHRRVEDERRRAEEERQRADQAQHRAARLAERLRTLGIDPDAL